MENTEYYENPDIVEDVVVESPPLWGNEESDDFAEYEAFRQKQDNFQSPDSGPVRHTRVPAETGAPTARGTDPESGDDVDDGHGEEPDAEQEEELPPWMKKRLERANKQRDKVEQRYKKQLAELESKVKQLEGGNAKPKRRAAANRDKPIPISEYDYDYPVKGDYKGDTDAYFKDLQRWEDNLPLLGGKYKDQQEPEETQEEDEEENEGESQEAVQNAVDSMFSDLEQVLDESEYTDDGVHEGFFNNFYNKRFNVSPTTLEWLADHEAETVLVARAFGESPREANRIFRKPESKQATALYELAGKIAQRDLQQWQQEDAEQGRDPRQRVPTVESLHAHRPTSARIGAMDFSQYEKMRRSQDAESGLFGR